MFKKNFKKCAWVFMYFLDLNICVLIIERRRRKNSGRRTARAASQACAWVFMYSLDLNICVQIIERRRRESSGRRTARGQRRSRQPGVCVGVYVFVRPKYMCTYYQAPKARERRSSDCTRACVRVRWCLCICQT